MEIQWKIFFGLSFLIMSFLLVSMLFILFFSIGDYKQKVKSFIEKYK